MSKISRRGVLAASAAAVAAPAAAQKSFEVTNEGELRIRKGKVGEIPVLVVSPPETANRCLVLWVSGFSGNKEGTLPTLKLLAQRGFVALGYDAYQHGERAFETREVLSTRVRGNIRRYFWPILARSAEETPQLLDWAVTELGVSDRAGMGGTSMGGDISISAAGVDPRLRAVSALVATPDWMRPGSFEPPGAPDLIAQAAYDRRNPLTNLEDYLHRPAMAFQSGADDQQVPPDGGQRFVTALQKIYGDQSSLLQVNLYAGVPHRVVPEMIEASLKWFEKHLMGKSP